MTLPSRSVRNGGLGIIDQAAGRELVRPWGSWAAWVCFTEAVLLADLKACREGPGACHIQETEGGGVERAAPAGLPSGQSGRAASLQPFRSVPRERTMCRESAPRSRARGRGHGLGQAPGWTGYLGGSHRGLVCHPDKGAREQQPQPSVVSCLRPPPPFWPRGGEHAVNQLPASCCRGHLHMGRGLSRF